MIRRNADGSITVGIIPENKAGVDKSTPHTEEKATAKPPRKPKKPKE